MPALVLTQLLKSHEVSPNGFVRQLLLPYSQAIYTGILMKNLTIKNTGDKETEHFHFTATEDCNLGHYMVADNTFDAMGEPSNKLRHMFAFPSYAVKKGDMIVLWSKVGRINVGKTTAGNPQHNFFWNLNEHVWNVTGDTAHLIDVRSSKSQTVGPYTK